LRCATRHQNYLVVLVWTSGEEYHVVFIFSGSGDYRESKYISVEADHALHVGDVEADVGERHPRQLVHADLPKTSALG